METISLKKLVLANKVHICDFCSYDIEKSEKYYVSTHKDDGGVYDWKTHQTCEWLAKKLKMYEESDEGLTHEVFTTYVQYKYIEELIDTLPKTGNLGREYKEVSEELWKVPFRNKLHYLVRKYKINKP